MDERIVSKNLFKTYAKYCYPVIFFVLIVMVVLMISYNNLAQTVILSIGAISPEQTSQINYEFIGNQLLNFTTFIFSCVVPIVIALLMSNYERNAKFDEKEISAIDLFTSKTIAGSLFIIIPFLANAIMFMILIWGGFFGIFQNDIILKLVLTTLFGLALSMLTFMLITIINISIKNPIIDSLLTLAIALFVMQLFFKGIIPIAVLITVIVFVWIALTYFAYTLYKKKSA